MTGNLHLLKFQVKSLQMSICSLIDIQHSNGSCLWKLLHLNNDSHCDYNGGVGGKIQCAPVKHFHPYLINILLHAVCRLFHSVYTNTKSMMSFSFDSFKYNAHAYLHLQYKTY